MSNDRSIEAGPVPTHKRYASSTDVARLAGVSQSAVSRTYRTGASVSAETRRKVIEAATALDYRPSAIPQIMLTHRSNLVAVVVGGLDNPFYATALEQFAARLQGLGYQVLLMHSPSDHALDGIIPRLASYRVDAVVSALPVISPACAEALARFKVPVVSFNTPVSNAWLSSVCSDNLGAGRLIADHFLARGARRFGFIAGPADSAASRDRLQGYRARLRDAGIRGLATVEADYLYDGGHQATLSLMSNGVTPDAIFCANDLMAMGAMDALRLVKKLRVPEDVLVAGVDDIPTAAWSSYDLTTVVQDAKSMVEQAIDLLRAAMTQQVEANGSRLTLPVALVARGSTNRITRGGTKTA